MNKGDLIEKISADANVSKTQAGSALDSFIGAVQKTLKEGGKVTLVGFGTFITTKRKARKGRNPKTGETIAIGARTVVKFRAGKELAEAM